jgi:hypothetical protein
LELQFGEVTKARASTPLILVSRQSTKKVPKANCSSSSRFPLGKDRTKPGQHVHGTVSREEHQFSHDVNGKKYRYEKTSISKRKRKRKGEL